MENEIKAKKQSKVKIWFNDKAVPFISKLGNQRHLCAIRDSFATMIPLIIAGGIGMLIDAIIFGGGGSGKVSLLGLFAKASGMSWDTVTATLAGTGVGGNTNNWFLASQIGALSFGQIDIATIGAMSLYFSFLLGYYLSMSRNCKNPLMAGLVSLTAFIIASMGQVSFFMSTSGLFTALIIGMLATEFFTYLSKVKALEINLPSGVPPAVGKSFAAFLPAFIVLASVAVLNIFFLAPAMAIPNSKLDVESGSYWNGSNNTWAIAMDNLTRYDTNTSATLWDGFVMYFGSLKIDGSISQFLNSGISTTTAMADINRLSTLVSTGQADQAINLIKHDFNTNGQGFFVSYIGMLSTDTFDKANNHWSGFTNIIKPARWTDLSAILASVNNGNNISLNLSYNVVSVASSAFGVGAAIYRFFTVWFIQFATGNGGVGMAYVYVLFISLFWFFGIHGGNIMGAIFEPIWWMILGINSSLIAGGSAKRIATSGTASHLGVFAKPFFDIFVNIGGCGATLSLLIMVMIFSRRRELKEVSKYALPAGCFNVNEPVMFGIPVVLNPTFLIPFIVGPLGALTIGWLATGPMHIVNVVYVTIPWTTPWFIGAVLATTDPMAILIALITFAFTLLVYFPFILIDNIVFYKNLKKSDPDQYEEEMKYLHDKGYRNEIKAKLKDEKKQAKLEMKQDKEAKKLEKQKSKKQN